MGDKEKKRLLLSRRDLGKAAAAFFATETLPVANILMTLESGATANSPQLLKASAIVRSLGMPNLFAMAMTQRFAVPENTDAAGLALDWSNQLTNLSMNLETCVSLERVTPEIDMPPHTFFSLLKNPEYRKNIASLPYKPDSSDNTIRRVISEANEQILREFVYRLSDRYPSLAHATSMKELAIAMRMDIASELKLLPNERILRRLNPYGVENLNTLLDCAPELFPQDKLDELKRLADDLAKNAKQTIRPEDHSRPQDEWQWKIGSVPHRLGLTDLQETAPVVAESGQAKVDGSKPKEKWPSKTRKPPRDLGKPHWGDGAEGNANFATRMAKDWPDIDKKR